MAFISRIIVVKDIHLKDNGHKGYLSKIIFKIYLKDKVYEGHLSKRLWLLGIFILKIMGVKNIYLKDNGHKKPPSKRYYLSIIRNITIPQKREWPYTPLFWDNWFKPVLSPTHSYWTGMIRKITTQVINTSEKIIIFKLVKPITIFEQMKVGIDQYLGDN